MAPDPVAVFLSRVKPSGATECWEYDGPRMPRGYGLLRFHGRSVYAHRFAYFLRHGVWPKPICLHLCDNPPCCNPAHLRAGTQSENLAMASERGRLAKSEATRQRMSASFRVESHPQNMPGENNPASKLTAAQVEEVRMLRAQGLTQQAIAEQVGVKQPQVSRILRGRSWRV